MTKGLDLKDKTCLITGANSGVGLEMTKCLNLCGCTVLMACRNTYAASVVAKNTCLKPDSLRLYELNLASLRSVRKCSDDLLNKEKLVFQFIFDIFKCTFKYNEETQQSIGTIRNVIVI